MITGAACLTYFTGGTRNVYLHTNYVPIALAGSLFGVLGGLLAGLLAGLLIGPFMPLDTVSQTPQLASGWLFRLGCFILVGGLVGRLSQIAQLRRDRLEAVIGSLAHTCASSLRAFSELVAFRDEQTAGHCERVALNARAIGEALNLPGVELNDLYWAGVLHDLGKVATPTDILLKPGRLTDAEFEVIKAHPAVGADLLMGVSPDFEGMAAGVRSHHERWDGKGYPGGHQGEGIPLFGRILAIVDVFEALTCDRPYRGPLDPEEALSYVREQAGQHFDPELVRVFERIYRQGEIILSSDESEQPDDRPPVVLSAMGPAADQI